MNRISKVFLTLLFTLSVSIIFAQSFEGRISYKVTMGNPYPEEVSEEEWQNIVKAQVGERGYMLQNYFYKGAKYFAEIEFGKELGYQAYIPEDDLIYSWAKDSEEAITLDSRKQMDEFTEIFEGEGTETIAGVECKSIIVKSVLGSMTIWYNSDYLKMDPALYKGFVYSHWEQIVEKIGCLPLKIKMEGLMGKVTQEAIEFKEEPIDDSKFTIPTFKTVTANPIN